MVVVVLQLVALLPKLLAREASTGAKGEALHISQQVSTVEYCMRANRSIGPYFGEAADGASIDDRWFLQSRDGKRVRGQDCVDNLHPVGASTPRFPL